MLRALCLFYFVLHNTKEISGLSASENLFNAVLYCIDSHCISCVKNYFYPSKNFFSAHFPFFFWLLKLHVSLRYCHKFWSPNANFEKCSAWMIDKSSQKVSSLLFLTFQNPTFKITTINTSLAALTFSKWS